LRRLSHRLCGRSGHGVIAGHRPPAVRRQASRGQPQHWRPGSAAAPGGVGPGRPPARGGV